MSVLRKSPLWFDERIRPAYGFTEIDWENSLSDRLIIYSLHGWGVSENNIIVPNLATRVNPNIVGSSGTIAWSPTSQGRVIEFTNSGVFTLALRYPNLAAWNNVPQWSMWMLFNPKAIDDGRLISKVDTWYLRLMSGGPLRFLRAYGTTLLQLDYTVNVGNWYSAALCFDTTNPNAAERNMMFVNGNRASQSGGSGSVTDDSASGLHIGARNPGDGFDGANAYIAGWAFWHRCLTESELRNLSIKPYTMLRPTIHRRYKALASVGTGIPRLFFPRKWR